MRVLIVLAAASPKVVSRDRLTETCWDGRVVSDDAMNRCILLLRNIARSHTPELFSIETVRGVGYCLIVPPSAERPWEGGAGDKSPAAPSLPGRRKPSLAPASLALLGIIAAGLAWAGWRARTVSDTLPMARVEVAPFQSMPAGDPEVAMVARATHGALIRVLGGADIPVVAAAALDPDPPLDADFHVQGAVDRDADAMAINVQVRDRQRRNVLWSGRFERSLSAPARFPDEAASRIGDILYCALRSRATSNRRMTDAVLSMMMQACELRRVGPDEAPKFLAAAERLRAAAPQLSGVQSIYALAAAAKSTFSPDATGARALVAASRAAAHRALQLDPNNAEAYLAIGISYGVDRNWAERDANFLRAEALSKGLSVGGDAHVGLLREVGRIREARELNRRTVADDPFSPDQLSSLSILTAAADGSEAAEPLLQRLRLVASPEQSDELRGLVKFWWDKPGAAAALLARMNGGSPTCLQAYLVWLERPPPRRGLPDSCRATQADWRMRMLAREGDVDGAYGEFAQAPANSPRGSPMLIALYYPEMRAFRADPRFMPLAARAGLIDYWTRTGHWPDFCTERDRPYDCPAVARELARPK